MNNITIRNIEPQNITINGGGSVIGIDTVYVNGIDVTEGSAAYVIVPTKLSELENDTHYITTETDPTVPYYVKQITIANINSWNNKQEALVSGSNIKTINNNSILGSGNLEIEGNVYTAGTGIDINSENVISNTITSYNDLTDLPTIPSKTSDLNNDSDFVSSDALAEVAFTGSYNSLSDTPVIPDSTSELINDSDFITGTDLANSQAPQNTELNYLNSIINQFPKVNGTGSSITLNNTIEAKMSVKLSPSDMTQEGTPTPTNPKDIHTTTGDNTLKVEGKNLCNNANNEIGYYNNGSFTTDSNYKISDYIKVVEGETYTGSIFDNNGTRLNNVVYNTFDSNKNYVGQFTSVNNYTIPSGITYLRIRNYSGQTSYITSDNYKYQLEKNSSPTSYLPYSSNTYPINLGTLEYSKIPNSDVEDEFIYNTTDTNLELNKWYLKKNIGKVVLNGSEDYIQGHNTVNNILGIRLNLNNVLHNTNTLSNYFRNVLFDDYFTYRDYGMICTHNTTNGYIYLSAPNASVTSTDNFKTWLGTHNTIVDYVLANPEYILLNDTLQEQLTNIYNNMMSKKGQTNLSQVASDLPMVITANALLDLNSLV